MQKIYRVCLLTFACFMVLGCAAPGAPVLRTTTADGQGPLIPHCQNVVQDYRVESFLLGYYLTTWGSAAGEGTQEGIRRALEDPSAKSTQGSAFVQFLIDQYPSGSESIGRFFSSPAPTWRTPINSLKNVPMPFCRRYYYPGKEVSRAAQSAIESLSQYRIITNDPQLGIFETDFFEQRHATARWRDRFMILVEYESYGTSVVRVFRDVYIDRSGTLFNQGASVGRQEAYILTRIDDVLANRR